VYQQKLNEDVLHKRKHFTHNLHLIRL